MRTRDRIALVGLFALAAAAGFVALRPASRDATEEGIARTRPEERSEALRLEGRGDPEAQSRPPAEPPRDASAAAGVLHVRGRVTGAPALPPGSHVRVVERVANEEHVRARGTPSADGTFEMDVAGLSTSFPRNVTVEAWVPGHGLGEAGLSPSATGTVDVEVPLPKGRTLRGRVVDPEGRGVAGLGVLLVHDAPMSGFEIAELPDPRDLAALERWRTSWIGTTVTGDDGRFSHVVGDGTGSLTLVSCDDAWWVDRESGSREVSEEEMEFTARPAYRVTFELVPDAPDDDPAKWSSIAAGWEVVEPQRGSSLGLGGFGHRTTVRAPVPDFGLQGFVGVLRADTPDHLAVTRRVELGPGAWTHEERIPLVRRPEAEYGTIAVVTSLRDAKGQVPTIRLLHRRPTGERSSTGDWVTPRTRADGMRTFRLPASQASVEVGTDLPLGDLLAWKGIVEVSAGRETEIAFPATPVGSVRLEFGGVWDREVLVTFSRRDLQASSLWKGLPSPGGTTLPAVPEGTWKVTTQHGSTFRSQQVAVVAGRETVVRVEAP